MLTAESVLQVVRTVFGATGHGMEWIPAGGRPFGVQSSARPWSETAIHENTSIRLCADDRVLLVVVAPEGLRVVVAPTGRPYERFASEAARPADAGDRVEAERLFDVLAEEVATWSASQGGLTATQFRDFIDAFIAKGSDGFGTRDWSLNVVEGKLPELRLTMPKRQYRLLLVDDEVRHMVAEGPNNYFLHVPHVTSDHIIEIERVLGRLREAAEEFRARRLSTHVDTDPKAWTALLDLAEKSVTPRLPSKALRQLRTMLDDPRGFVARNEATLARRGVSYVIPTLHSIAFIDALIDSGAATELDWKAGGDEVLEAGKRIARAIGVAIDLPGPDDEETPVWIGRLADAFAPVGYTLVCFDIESDSYPIALLDAERATPLCHAAEKANVSVAPWGS